VCAYATDDTHHNTAHSIIKSSTYSLELSLDPDREDDDDDDDDEGSEADDSSEYTVIH